MTNTNSIYRIKEWILSEIESGRLNPGDPVPSTLSIAREVNAKTDDVYDAVDELITEQVLTQSFEAQASVKEPQPFFYPLDKLLSISKMIENEGFKAGTIFMNLDQQPATQHDRKALSLNEGEYVTIIERIRTADGSPVVYCLDKVATSYLTCAAFQEHDESILTAIKAFADIKIAYSETEIESVSYEPKVSEALESAPNEALMLLRQVHYDHLNRPILYSFNYFKSEVVKFKAIRKTEEE
ncbi:MULTISPECIES: GntR family transcriptional regulator [Staphylococcus]|uniref:GntR family transcriptional regulator n=1 Tax=Staphylococcus TaxID=1279 RepID=UPI000DF746F4|nr:MULTISPECIES: GntR family transcriptional regulator [unclassified Staphylococcus]UXV34079.1 GntR family transcriptional regulator [Staphylococcus sp. IVB6181]